MSRSRGPSPFDVLANLFPKASQAEPAAPSPAQPTAPRPMATKGASPASAPAPPKPNSSNWRKSGSSRATPVQGKFSHKGRKAAKPVQPAANPYPRYKPGRLTPTISSEARVAPPPKPTGPEHLIGAEAISYVRARVDLTSLNAASTAPLSASPDTQADVARRVSLGAAILGRQPEPDPEGFRIGLDFGTSATKIVLCSDTADFDYALETPVELQVEEEGRRQQHLWRTCVWFNDETQMFQLTPCNASRAILGFKTGLIQGDGNRMLAAGLSHNAAATAYLALMIAYTLGYDAERLERAGVTARHYSRFHVGVPVPSLEEDLRVPGFHRVVQAAFALAPLAEALSLGAVQTALTRPLAPTTPQADTPYQLFEELAGVVAGYLLTPERAGGPHIIVDVGAATLDVATFYIPDGEYPLEVYESGVDLFGAQALACALAAEVPEPTFRAACQAHTQGVLSKTFRTKNYSFLPGPQGASKPMIYVGGGRLTALHQSTYEGYSKAYLAPMRSPGVGRWLKRDLSTDQERLLLAWGLAQDPATDAIPTIRPPSQVVPSLRRHSDWEAGYVGSEIC